MPAFTCGICDSSVSDMGIPVWISIEGIYSELCRIASHVSTAHGVSRDALMKNLEIFRNSGEIRGRGGPGYIAGALPDGMEWFRVWDIFEPPKDIHLS